MRKSKRGKCGVGVEDDAEVGKDDEEVVQKAGTQEKASNSAGNASAAGVAMSTKQRQRAIFVFYVFGD